MPRLKDMPKTLYLGMTREGDLHIIPDNDPLEYVENFMIAKTAKYIRWTSDTQKPSKKPVSKPRTRKKAKKTPETDATKAPQGEKDQAATQPTVNNPPSKPTDTKNSASEDTTPDKPMWKCNNLKCPSKGNLMHVVSKTKKGLQCTRCLRLNTVEKIED